MKSQKITQGIPKKTAKPIFDLVQNNIDEDYFLIKKQR